MLGKAARLRRDAAAPPQCSSAPPIISSKKDRRRAQVNGWVKPITTKSVRRIQELRYVSRHDSDERAEDGCTSHQESDMANSKRNGTPGQPPADRTTGEPRYTLEAPCLWHTGTRNECWTSTSITDSRSWGIPFAEPGRPALRLRRPARRRTTLHSSRTFPPAEARFVAPCNEFLTD